MPWFRQHRDLRASGKDRLRRCHGSYRSDPHAGCPEYIELFNATAEAYNLAGHWVRDAAHQPIRIPADDRTANGGIVEPGHFAVLTPDSEALQDVRPVSGIRELYLLLTGDHEMYGRFNPDRVTLANVTPSTMTSVLDVKVPSVGVLTMKMGGSSSNVTWR